MAQFRSTADILDLALTNGGEVTNGNSPYETQILNFLNRVHFTLIAGGTIPIGKDETVEIDEAWPWARSKRSLILELQPKQDTGTVTLTNGSEAGTFSSAPTPSLAGWHLRMDGREEVFKIASHTAGATAFELDAAYTGATGSGLDFEAFKLDYELVPDFIVIDSSNNKVEFQETSGTTITSTLTSGTYSPSALATEVKTQMDADGASTYTVTYSAVTRKFTIASNRAGGGGVFILVGTGSNSKFSAHKTLGFDDENTADAASVESTYILGGMCRFLEPMKLHRGFAHEGSIFGTAPESFQRNYPLHRVRENLPERFSVISESADGIFTVRFNAYPKEETRVEVEFTEVPRDLKDNSSSIPLVPRKHVDVLEDAATFYLMLLKSDDRSQTYAQLLKGKLKAMIAQHRGAMLRAGANFGRIISRRDKLFANRFDRGIF